MPRAPEHPSGAKQLVTIRLSPAHIARLDQAVTESGTSRSIVIAKLVERIALKDEPAGTRKNLLEDTTTTKDTP